MSMFSEKPAETKLLLTLLTFGVTLGGSIGVCWLTGSDPWGEVPRTARARFAHALKSGCLAAHALSCVYRRQVVWQHVWMGTGENTIVSVLGVKLECIPLLHGHCLLVAQLVTCSTVCKDSCCHTGGASWSSDTAAAAAAGALASGPLVALYAAMWMPSARRTFPAVDSRQNGVTSTLQPIVNNLTWAQVRTCAASWFIFESCTRCKTTVVAHIANLCATCA